MRADTSSSTHLAIHTRYISPVPVFSLCQTWGSPVGETLSSSSPFTLCLILSLYSLSNETERHFPDICRPYLIAMRYPRKSTCSAPYPPQFLIGQAIWCRIRMVRSWAQAFPRISILITKMLFLAPVYCIAGNVRQGNFLTKINSWRRFFHKTTSVGSEIFMNVKMNKKQKTKVTASYVEKNIFSTFDKTKFLTNCLTVA